VYTVTEMMEHTATNEDRLIE